MKKIGIIGGGSIGLLLAGYLHKAGFKVKIYTNTKEQADELNKSGLTFQNKLGKSNYKIKSMSFSELDQYDVDYLFIAVKQYHLQQIIPKLLSLPGQVHSIIFMQNGMSHIKYFDKLLSKVDSLYVAIVEHGAFKHSHNFVTHTGVGEMKVGCYDKDEQLDLDIWYKLTDVGFSTTVYANWFEIMEKKLVVNGVINPLTALFGIENGMLTTNPYYFQIMRQLFDEISLVLDCGEGDWTQIIEICKKTKHNRSSMLKDIEEGRMTEIDAITGVILEKAASKTQVLRLNEFIFQSIKGLEIQKRGEMYE